MQLKLFSATFKVGKTYLKANRLPATAEEISAGEKSRLARNKEFRSETSESLITSQQRIVEPAIKRLLGNVILFHLLPIFAIFSIFTKT